MTARRLLLVGPLALAALGPATAQQGPATPDYAEVSLADPAKEREALALMDSIRCVVCQGQPISGSNADLAGDMRRVIRERIAAGESPEQVRRWLIGKYGDWVSFRPVPRPETAALWLAPLVALLGGAALVLRRLKPRRRG